MSFKELVGLAYRVLHSASFFLLVIMALGAICYTLLCSFGFTPWLVVEAQFGDWLIPGAGGVVQVAVTVALAALLFFVPMSARVIALESSHRSFQISMEDVSRAYHFCHAADRAGVFTMSSEFDAVRERLAFMRDHPMLESLEPEVLEVAAQMGQQARELGEIYSEEKVQRAKKFLHQRQEEAERLQEVILEAIHICDEIRKWSEQVDVEEATVKSQIAKLHTKLDATLPELGMRTVKMRAPESKDAGSKARASSEARAATPATSRSASATSSGGGKDASKAGSSSTKPEKKVVTMRGKAAAE